jgi:hypothetical protein
MNALIVCLSFMQVSASPVHVPKNVDEIVRNRITRQAQAQYPWLHIEFDNPSCSERGEYEYGGDSLILRAETPFWIGRFEAPISDLIEGYKQEFPVREPEDLAVLPREKTEAASPKWVPWTLGAVGAGVAIFVLKAALSGASATGSDSRAGAAPVRLRSR